MVMAWRIDTDVWVSHNFHELTFLLVSATNALWATQNRQPALGLASSHTSQAPDLEGWEANIAATKWGGTEFGETGSTVDLY